MDCSTFSNRTAVDDTIGDEGAGTLRRQLDAAVRACETAQQELHETRRNYQTALDVQQHLTAELDAQRVGEDRRAADLKAKISSLQEDLHTLRDERTKVADMYSQQIESSVAKIKELQHQLTMKAVEEKLPEEKAGDGTSDELISLKQDHNNLLSLFDEQKSKLDERDVAILNLKEQLLELDERVTWSSDALQRKKEELESMMEVLQSAQTDLALANCELQRMKNEGNSHAAKGNSLFAEVDDKRQELAKTLIQMKQNNTQLKRELANKQTEIDSLMCEKKTLWEEVTGTSGVIDAEMIESYERRISTLSRTVERQRCETASWFTKHYEQGGTQAAEWVAGVLSHLKNRCKELTDDMLELSIDNLSKASQIRDLHKKLASQRLESLDNNRSSQRETTNTERNILSRENLYVTKQELKPKVEKFDVASNKENILENKEKVIKKEEQLIKKEKNVNDVKKKVTF